MKINEWPRHGIQALWAFITNSHVTGFVTGKIYTGKLKNACVPGLNCYSCPGAVGACPIGSLQSALSGVSPRIPFYVVGLLLLFALLFGRFICGWLCPFGFIQELIYKLPLPKLRKLALFAWLKWLKYAIAIVFVIMLPLVFYLMNGIGEPAFCEYICPAGTFEAALPLFAVNSSLRQAAGWINVLKLSLLAVTIMAAMVIYRPFCRFICPLGAFYGLFNKLAAFGIAVDAERCTHCGACQAVCPMDVKIAGDRECISCGKCQTHCRTQAIYYRNPIARTNPTEVKGE